MSGETPNTVLQEFPLRRELLWARNERKEASKPFTARASQKEKGQLHFVDVTLTATPREDEHAITLSAEVLATLREAFGADFEYQRHCLCSAVECQLECAKVGGEMPAVENRFFRAEVIDVQASRGAVRETSGALLTVAAMDATAAFLTAWAREQARARGFV